MVSVYDAAHLALEELRQEKQDYFYLVSQSRLDIGSVKAEGSTLEFVATPCPITQEVIKRIGERDGVKNYASEYMEQGCKVTDKKNRPLKLVENKLPAADGDAVTIKGVTDSGLYGGSEMKLLEGKHIKSDFVHAALNHLHPGDKIRLAAVTDSEEKADTSGIEVMVTGKYQTFDQSGEAELYPYELLANVIYTDYETAFKLDQEHLGTTAVKFSPIYRSVWLRCLIR